MGRKNRRYKREKWIKGDLSCCRTLDTKERGLGLRRGWEKVLDSGQSMEVEALEL